MLKRSCRVFVFSLLVPLAFSTVATAQTQDEVPDEELPEEEATEDAPIAPAAPAEKPGTPPATPPPASADSDDAFGDDDFGEEGVEEAGADVARPPPKGKGAIWGVVTDTKFNEPLVEAPIQVVGTKIQTLTDVEGRFRLELPPGNYVLRVSYELHKSTRLDGVQIQVGQVSQANVQLTPDEKSVEGFVVETKLERNSLEGQTLERKRAAAVGAGVGRAEIARTPDRNAAEAAQRVVGSTIVDARFVYVRGLGERYTNALLNG